MTTPADINKLPADLQADAWFQLISFGNPDEDQLVAYIEWLRESDEHVKAYGEAEATWNLMNTLQSEPEFREPPSVSSHGKVFELRNRKPHDRQSEPQTRQTPAHSPKEKTAFLSRLKLIRLAQWSSVLASILVAAFFIHSANPPNETESTVFRTAIGNVKTWQLDDGSEMTLNTNSQVKVTYTQSSRNITLTRGEVLFNVVKDPARPFVVAARSGSIEVLGTLFNVRILPGDTVRVSLVEGSVGVKTAKQGDSAPSKKLTAHQEVFYAANGQLSETQSFTPADTLLWTERKLDLNNVLLSEAVKEINRYMPRKLVIEDPGIADQNISIFISINNLNSLFTSLESLYDIESERRFDKIILRKKNKKT